MENLKKIQEILDAHLKKCGKCMLNPDKETVDRLFKVLLARKNKYGEFYCPCRIVSGDIFKDKNIICPCIYHQKEIKEKEICHCGLLVAATQNR
ncbi:MAG: ferredoxin-thioredoxin reductase catalytic domain-containing protein [Candidatus Omnitrophota bacterium]